MSQAIFRHRSGRVISTARLVLASVFLLAIWVDPSQPSMEPGTAYAMLGIYVLFSAGLLLLTWRNWWLDYRLAGPSHLVDIVAFGTLVFFTEGYTSPFYTFFVFLLLSAAIRWGWRETALTAVLVLLLFVVAGSASLAINGAEFDVQRLLVRFTHLIVLSLIFIWFGFNQEAAQPARPPNAELLAESEGAPVRQALRRAAERLAADRIVFVWAQREEPWTIVTELDSGTIRTERIAPDVYPALFGETAGNRPFLFDCARQRALSRGQDGVYQLHAFSQALDPDFAARFRLGEGLAIRMRAQDYEGEMLVMGIAGLCVDDLEAAESIGQEISALFDQSSMVTLYEEAAVTRARASLARDLHDSVVQVLAGASFRLEALKSWIRAGEDPEPEIEAVKSDFAAEQRNVRNFIAGLRSGRGSLLPTDIRAALPALLDQLQRRWNLDCSLAVGDEPVDGPAWIEHELHQIIREAAANAARHGKARSLKVELAREGGEMIMAIKDDGDGFPARPASDTSGEAGASFTPWSVNERVQGLGGTLSLMSGPDGSRLEIRMPLEGRP